MAITIVQKNKSKGVLTWYARVPDPITGRVHYFTLHTTVKTEAKYLLQVNIKNGEYDIKAKRDSITIGEALDKYERSLRSRGVKEDSIDTILRNVRTLEPLFSRRVSDITTSELAQVFQDASQDLKPVSYRNRRTMVTMFFKYIVDVLELLPVNPAKKAIPRRKNPRQERHFWTLDQVDRIIAAAPTPDNRLCWAFMAYAGLRKSEAVAMTPDKIRDGAIHLVGKGDKAAILPISPRLQREIDRYGDREWRFHYQDATLKNAARRAIPEGFPGVAHAHRFRHSYGSIMIKQGVNIKVIQKALRHENITITLDIYAHILDEDIKDSICKVFD